MGVAVSRDVEVIRDARIVADNSWQWLGPDRQEELFRIFFAFCVQQTDCPAVQKMALAFPFEIFRARARAIIDNLFKPIAKIQSAGSNNNTINHTSNGTISGNAAAAVTDSDAANNPEAIHALYRHLGIIFAQMGFKTLDVVLFYDLLLDALLEVGDDAQAEEISVMRDDLMMGAATTTGNVSAAGSPQQQQQSGPSSSSGVFTSTGSGGGLTPLAPTRSDLTPQRPQQRPQSGGGGSFRNRQHARTPGVDGPSPPSGRMSAAMLSGSINPNASTATLDMGTIDVHFKGGGGGGNSGNGANGASSGSNITITGKSEVSVSNQFNTVFGPALLSPPPGPNASTPAANLQQGGAARGNGGGNAAGARRPSPLFGRSKWSIREQKAWAMLLRHSACDVTLDAHGKGLVAMQLLTTYSPSGKCPMLRTPEGEILSAECVALAELLFPNCFSPTSFVVQQLRTQESYMLHVCSSSSSGAEGSSSSVPILERRMRFVALRHRYLYIYEPSTQTNTIRIDEPCAVVDVEHLSRDIISRVDTTTSVAASSASTGADRTPMHALVLTMQQPSSSSGGRNSSNVPPNSTITHTLYLNSAIQSGSWHEALSRSMAFFATNPFFDSPAPPLPSPPKAPTAAMLAQMGSASFADALPLMSQYSAGAAFTSASRNARFLGIADAVGGGADVASGGVGSSAGGSGASASVAAPIRRFNPNTDLDFAAAFRNSFPFKAKLGDFEFYELLGAGNFGRVVRCRHIYSKTVFALKIIRKERFKGIRNVLEVRRERKVLETADNPYIMRIHRTYQTRTRVYFLLDYLPGGELLRHTNKSPGHRFNEEFSKFVLAELACACEYMRVNKIVHRDIKGDNLVLDEHGHLILTDFGFAKQLLEGKKHKTCCGTLAYIAPEMLLSNNPDGYGYQVDWWSTGVVLFTVLTGFFPFLKSRRKDTIDAITTQPLQFPQRPSVGELPMDLCHKLLNKDPSKRYSTLAQIKAHPWYAGFNWEAVEAKALPPPYQSLLHQPAPVDPKAASTDKAPDAPPAPPAATPHDEVTLEQELKDAAKVNFECADDVRREEDIFGSFLDAQEDAGSNREDDSGDSAADSDTDDEWNEGGSDNDEDSHTETAHLASTASGSMTMVRPRGYSSSSLIR